MKKRIISLILALALCVGMLPAPAWAEEPTDPTQAVEVVGAANPSGETDPTTEPTEEETEPTEAETEPTEGPKAAEVPAEETAAPGEDEAVAAVQAMIDALPDVEDMSESYLDALEAAYSAFDALSEAQQAQITGVEKLEALFGWVNSQVSTLAAEKTISGEVTWNNQTFNTPVKLTGDTTLTLVGDNKIECDQPLDLNGKNLTIQGTGTLELVGKGGNNNYRVDATLCDSTYTSYNSGGALTLAGGTVKVSGSDQNAVCVYNLKLNGGKLEAYGGSNAGIACAILQTTSGSLYATGDDYGISMYRPSSYDAAVNKLTILVSKERDVEPADADMEVSDENAIARAGIGDFRTVYIGEVSGPLLSVKAQKGYLYEGTVKTATFALSGRNVDLSALTLEWIGPHTGLEASADGKTLTVTTEKTVQAGTYRLKVSVGGASRTAVVTVSGPPICIYDRPVDTISTDPEAGEVHVSACPTDGRTGSIDFQWKREDGTVICTGETVLLYDLVEQGMLTQDASKSWLQTIRIYCTLSYDGYSLNTDTVTLGLSSCPHPAVDHEGNCLQCGQKNGGNGDALIVREDGLYHRISNEEPGDANVGPFMYGGGNFYLTGDVQKTTVDLSDTDVGGKNVTLDLQGHTMKSLQMGNFPYGTFTVKNGTLGLIDTVAGGKLILENIHYKETFISAQFDLTVQGENTHFELPVVFHGNTHLMGGHFDGGLDSNCVGRALELLEDGFAFYDNDNKVVDATDYTELVGREIHVAAHPEHTPDSSGHCPCGYTAAAMLATEAGKQYFTDFSAAIEAAKAATGSTLTLLRDVTLTGDNLYINSGTFTIDWQDHTLSGEMGNALLCITEAAKVTLTDSLGTGGLRNVGGAAIAVHYGGSLTIQGGIYSPQLSKERTSYGSIQISGGRFENPKGAGRVGALFCDSGALADLLAPGYTFAYDDDGLFDVYNVKMSEAYRSVCVVEHPTHELDDDTDTCACGFHCDHKDVGDDGVCAACGSQMAASVTAGDGSVTYYRNIAGAIAAATASPDMVGHCDTTVTLLNDIDETISNNGMDFVLDLNGKTLAGLELKDYHFALMDSQQTGTIEQLHSDFHAYTYLKEGWCLVDAGGMSLNLLTRLETSEPIQVVHAGVVDIERSEWGTVSYGQQTIPFSLRFRLEDGLKVSSVKVSWTYEVAVREPIGSVQTLTKDEDGFYTFDTSKPLDEHPLNYGRLRAGLTYVLLSQIELELEDGQTRRIVLSGYRISTEKADLSDAVITLDSTALTYAPNPQTAVGQEQTKTVTSVTLYGNTLTEGTDYEVTGNVGTNAGTYTLTVKAKADSKFYTGSKTVTWEIKPLHVAVADTSLPGKTYDGTAAAQVPVLTMQSGNDTVVFRENTDYILKKAEFSGPNVGAQMISILIGLTGDAAKNYQLEQNEWVIMSEITPATPEAPTTGTLTVTNGNVTGYTLEDLESLLAPLTDPCTYGTVTYGTPTVKTLDEAYAMTAVIENGALRLNVTGTGNTEGRVATVTVPVQTSNYRDFTLTVYVEAKNKTVPQVKAVGTTEICYGQKLEESRVLSSQVYEPDSETTVPGSFRWEEPETLLDAGTHPMKMIFTPEDTSKYAQTTAMVNVTVNPRPVTLSGVTVADKIYDGTAEATVKDKGTFSNAVSGDTMDYTVTAVFEDKNVAAGGEKTAYLTVTLNGDTGKNYTLAEDSQKEARARMFPKEVNITGGFTA